MELSLRIRGETRGMPKFPENQALSRALYGILGPLGVAGAKYKFPEVFNPQPHPQAFQLLIFQVIRSEARVN